MPMRKFAVVRGAESAAQSEVRLRLAFATQDGKFVNAHFGSARRFVVYEVSESEHQVVETIAFDAVADESGEHAAGADDRNQAKIDALSGVHVVFLRAIGGPVAARVIQAKIHPIKITAAETIDQVIARVQEMLRGGERPAWLGKVLKQGANRSMDFLDEDDE